MEEVRLEFRNTDYMPILKEVSFKLGIFISSVVIGYFFVTDKPCLNFYHIMQSKVDQSI
jgi:hypothetical protein